jgi:hypothetical protein
MENIAELHYWKFGNIQWAINHDAGFNKRPAKSGSWLQSHCSDCALFLFANRIARHKVEHLTRSHFQRVRKYANVDQRQISLPTLNAADIRPGKAAFKGQSLKC